MSWGTACTPTDGTMDGIMPSGGESMARCVLVLSCTSIGYLMTNTLSHQCVTIEVFCNAVLSCPLVSCFDAVLNCPPTLNTTLDSTLDSTLAPDSLGLGPNCSTRAGTTCPVPCRDYAVGPGYNATCVAAQGNATWRVTGNCTGTTICSSDQISGAAITWLTTL